MKHTNTAVSGTGPRGASLATRELELISHMALLGKQHGSDNLPGTAPELRALAINTIESAIQKEIFLNQEQYLPVSGLGVAHRIGKEAKEKIQPLAASIADDELALMKLGNEKKNVPADTGKRTMRRLAAAVAVIIAVAEACFAYSALRFAGFSPLGAFFSSLAIAGAVGFGIHIFGSSIRRAGSTRQKRLRLAAVLIAAFVGFYTLGILRAHGQNESARLTAALNPEHIAPQNSIAPMSIAAVSFILFAAALAFAIYCAKADREHAALQEYDRIQAEIKQREASICKSRALIEKIEAEAARQTAEALANYEAAYSVENRLQTIAKQAVSAFIESNIRHRPDKKIPECFIHPPECQFTLFFDTLKQKS